MKPNRDPLTIRSIQGDYSVNFVSSVGALVGRLLDSSSAENSAYLIVCDELVASIFSEQLAPAMQRFPALVLPSNESTKSLDGVQTLIDWLLLHKATRTTKIVAIGGGCIQDLVSFTAHVYYRGISWVFAPTTLLSQADSCIGAKSGINFLPYKNPLGAFHAPSEIIITDEFLTSLPESEIASGFGEILKLSVTSTRSFLPRLEEALKDHRLRLPQLPELVRASLAAKQEIIEQDELEGDLRRILNYGHSFGHALEAIGGHVVPHGIAVMWGIDIVNALGVSWGITDQAVADRIGRVIRRSFDYCLPFTPKAGDLLEMVSRDKKMSSGRMQFAVLVDVGTFRIVPRAIDDTLKHQVQTYLESPYPFRAL